MLRDADRSDARFTIVAGPREPTAPFKLTRPVARFSIEPTRIKGRGLLSDQIGTYLKPPKDRITFTILDGRGSHLARCVYPPESYLDNTHLACPLPDISRARTLVVRRSGSAETALIAHDRSSGYLIVNQDPSLGGRIHTVLSRVATTFPNGVGSAVLIAGLFASVALTLLGVLLAVIPSTAPRSEVADDHGDAARATTDASGAAGAA